MGDPRPTVGQARRRRRGTPPASGPSVRSGTRGDTPQPPGLAAAAPPTAARPARTAASSPETTTDDGPLIAAAMPAPAGQRRADLVGRPGDRHHGAAARAAPASAGHARRPAAHASAQREHPGHMGGGDLTDRVAGQHVGRGPPDSSSRNSATSTANSAAWVYPSRSSAAAASPATTVAQRPFRCGSSPRTPRRRPGRTPGTARQAARPCRGAGSPGRRTGTRSWPAARRCPRASPAPGAPSASALRPRGSPPRSGAVDHRAVLECGRGWPASSRRRRQPGVSSARWARAAGLGAQRRGGPGRSTGHGRDARPAARASCGGRRSGGGGSSRMTCALVPLMPNEETAGAAGTAVSGPGRPARSAADGAAAQSTCGVGWSTCSVAADVRCRSAMTILMTPPRRRRPGCDRCST